MTMVSGSRSTLNPNAPLFIPAAFREVEDFSPEWWDLVKTSTWFRDYWLDQHQEGFEEDEEDDIANLLPDSFDLGCNEDFLDLGSQLEEAFSQSSHAQKPLKEKFELPDIEIDGKKIVGNVNSMKSPKVVPAKYWEKPVQCMSPKYSPRRIQQPR